MTVIFTNLLALWLIFTTQTADTSSNKVKVFSDLPAEASQEFQPILHVVENNLQTNGFELEISDELSDETNLRFTVDGIEDSIFLDIEIFTPRNLPESPILYGLFDRPTRIIRRQSNGALTFDETKNMATIVTALSLYSIDRCDLAQAFSDKVNLTLKEWNLPVNFYQGNCAVIDNDLETAARFYNDAMYFADNVSTSVAANTNFAWALMQLPPEQRNGFQVNNVDAAIWLAVCVRGFCDPEKEVESFKRRAQLYALNSDFEEAIESLASALSRVYRRQDSFYLYTNVELHILRGQLYRNIYEWDNSLADFNTAIELAPDYADAYYERGLLYYSVLQTGQELREQALADFKIYLELAPDGQYADEAQEYVENIELELQALNE